MKSGILFIVLLAACAVSVESLRVHNKANKNGIKDSPPFKTFHVTQFLDHFNLKDDRTFQQRYLVNGKYRKLANHIYSIFFFKCSTFKMTIST
jgi:hypothetical protein